MRTMQWNQEKTAQPPGIKQWHYALLVEDIEVDGFHCESYGIVVRDPDTKEEATVRHITVSGSEALALLNTVARSAVSPVTLRDVVEDYLGR